MDVYSSGWLHKATAFSCTVGGRLWESWPSYILSCPSPPSGYGVCSRLHVTWFTWHTLACCWVSVVFFSSSDWSLLSTESFLVVSFSSLWGLWSSENFWGALCRYSRHNFYWAGKLRLSSSTNIYLLRLQHKRRL